MSWQVLMHPQVEKWIQELGEKEREKVMAAITALELRGPLLGRPLADHLRSSKIHNLKELRPLGTTLRIIFFFDSKRRAILLAAGNKFGSWHRWYQLNIPLAESRAREFFNSLGEAHE
ncbi:MAG: hypothetical protein EBW33_06210 [Actinobacteria bacterium]|nr:hypothetical protein [Actinomycetota bacterium]NCX00941.1 hypothetical protein [Actinomycetota bacterium]NCX33645.1 hypothetical protein [Actinomycetota bacterium]